MPRSRHRALAVLPAAGCASPAERRLGVEVDVDLPAQRFQPQR